MLLCFRFASFFFSKRPPLLPISAHGEAAAAPDSAFVQRVAVVTPRAGAHRLVVLHCAVGVVAAHRLAIVVAWVLECSKSEMNAML